MVFLLLKYSVSTSTEGRKVSFLTEFIKWQKENTDKIYEDEFSNKYAVNFQKILGGNNTQEYNNSRIKKELYKYLKMNLKNIIEYEFSF